MELTFTSPPAALCIVRLSAIGDTCHTVPVVRAIQDTWPDTRITWIIGAVEHGLLRGLEDVELVVLDKRQRLRGYAELRARLRGRSFPLMLHMHASLRANVASLLVPARARLGFDRQRARDYQWLVTNHRIAPRSGQHVMDGFLEFVRAIGIEPGPPRWNIPIADADREAAARVVSRERPTLVISPCTGQRFRNYRNWRAERYAQLADYAHTRFGAVVLLTGGSTAIEREYGEAIGRLTKCAPVNLIGRTSLKELLAILEQATVLVCPDSGPAHMATAAGTPVVGLYATSNRHRTGPYFSQHLVVDRYPQALRQELGRPVSEVRFGRRVRNPDAMDLITVADVIEKLDQVFAESGVRPLR